MYKPRPMRYISILLSLLATSSCSVDAPSADEPMRDTVVIEYPTTKDTLIVLDTAQAVKKNAKNLWTPKCVAYGKWRTS
jgi:hypothetical protein